MSTPKTTFYLSNGDKLTDIFPLENNGPGNLSIPNDIYSIDSDPSGSQFVTIHGDLVDRFVTLTADSTVFSGTNGSFDLVAPPAKQAEFDALVAAGLAVGMFVDVGSGTFFADPHRIKITGIDSATRTITLDEPFISAMSGQAVRFCFPFAIVDLDGSTPSPYSGEYGAYSASFDGKHTKITLSATTPLLASTFDMIAAEDGLGGSVTIRGVVNANELFYVGSTFVISGNSFAPANANYLVDTSSQSGEYTIQSVAIGASNTQIIFSGDAHQFFVAGQQALVSFNTSHSFNGPHLIISSSYAGGETTVTVSGVPSTGTSGPANGRVRPAVATAVVSTVGTIPTGTVADGTVSAPPSLEMYLTSDGTSGGTVLPPSVTPGIGTHTILWKTGGDLTGLILPGHSVAIKDNDVYTYRAFVATAVTYDSLNDVTSVSTTVSGTSAPSPSGAGKLLYPAPAMPYGHVRYSVLTAASPFKLIGRGATHFNSTTSWGQALQDNAIHHLENFANTTAPESPLVGQLWYNPSLVATGLNVNVDGTWHGVIVEGVPALGSIDMNGYAIYGIDDINQATPDLTQALNVGSADARYVNVTGDAMTGVLSMTDHKVTMVADTDIPVGSTINTGLANGQDALNVRTADARYVNVDGDTMLASLDMGANRILNAADPTHTQDVATKGYVDSLTSGITWIQPILDSGLFDDSLSSAPSIPDPDMLFYRSYFVKPVGYAIVGVTPGTNTISVSGNQTSIFTTGQKFTVKGNATSAANIQYTVTSSAFGGGNTNITVSPSVPGSMTVSGSVYHSPGAWNGLEGRVVTWDGTSWIDVVGRTAAVGDRFGVFLEVDNDDPSAVPGGSFAVGTPLGTPTASAAGKIVTINVINNDYSVDWGTSGGTYPVQTPVEPDAVSVLGRYSPHFGHSYTFRGTWGSGAYNTGYKWIEFAGPSMLIDGAGLKYTGNILNVGQGTGLLVSANSVSLDTTFTNAAYVRRDGTTAMTAALSLGGNKITNVSDPTASLDAVNLQYLAANYVSSSGGSTITGNLDMNGYKVVNSAAPTAGSDLANKTYVDTKVSKSGDTMTGQLTMSSALGLAVIDMGTTNKIINLADATASRDALNLQTADGRYVARSGSTMTGFLTLSANPTASLHAATKQYVDSLAGPGTTIDGGSF